MIIYPSRLSASTFIVALFLPLAAPIAIAQTYDPAGVTRLEILEHAQAFGGQNFGNHGAYEILSGIAHLQIDPTKEENQAIADLEMAPRNALGLVAYDADVVILRPKDPLKARRVLIFDVANRGMKILPTLNGAPIEPSGALEAGDGFLMRQGYTMVWVGWQADVAPAMIDARFPIAVDNHKPIIGRIHQEAVFDNPGDSGTIALPYPAANLAANDALLTVQATASDAPRTIPTDQWHYIDERQVSITRPADMDAGAIYRFHYSAKDPFVAGLGFTAVRDVITFLRHNAQDMAGNPNPLADLASAPCEQDANGSCPVNDGGFFDVAVAFGVSQSGRFLHDWLWQGFNTDLHGRRVFDGLMPVVAGARKTWTNVRFAQPGRFSRQHEDHGVYGFQFPFTYTTLTDPVTGVRDGLMKACGMDSTCPKIFDLNTSAEFWQAGASLLGTGGTDHDIELPDEVRLFLISGDSHYPGGSAPQCVHAGNPLVATPLRRALLVRLVEWVAGRSSPPESRWPSLADGTLVDIGDLNFPDLSSLGFQAPEVINRPEPPTGKMAWPVFVPSVDNDGIDQTGIRLPAVAASTGTYLGWNIRKPGYGAGDLCNLYGSFIPYAPDEALRGADPRPSLAARYGDKNSYSAAIVKATESLLADGLLLEEDATAIRARALNQDFLDQDR